jgi:hypothetical protein
LSLYDDTIKANNDDLKYNEMAKYYDRVFKIVDTQHKSLYKLEKIANQMQRRKEERENNPLALQKAKDKLQKR